MATAQYPAAVVTDTYLPNVGDGIGQSTLLNGAHNDAVTTITVDDTTNFASAGFFIVDSECVVYTGKTATTFTGCTRGALGTSAASHSDNARVACSPVGRVWDQMQEEIKAIQTELGVDPAGAQATVVSRLDTLDTTVSGKAASSHTHAISTDITGLGTNVATFLATPSSANLRAALTDESGGGSAVFATIDSIASGEILKWNGSDWINNTLAEAGIAADSHTHVGTWDLVATGTLSSGQFSITGLSMANYPLGYMVELRGIQMSTDDSSVCLRINGLSTGYDCYFRYRNTSTSGNHYSTSKHIALGINAIVATYGIGNAADESAACTIYIRKPVVNEVFISNGPNVWHSTAGVVTTNMFSNTIVDIDAETDVDEILIYADTGTITAGTCHVYGGPRVS